MKKIIHRFLFIAVLLSYFITGINAQGPQLQWVRSITGSATVSLNKSALAKDKSLCVTGSFTGTADFDPGSDSTKLSSPNGNYYVARYDALGKFVFAFQLNAGITAILIDKQGNICITGKCDSTADFDPGAGTANLPGISRIYMARYDKDGNYINSFRVCTGSTPLTIYSAALDTADNLLVTGSFTGTANFNPSGTALNLSSNGSSEDIFLSKYSGSGSLMYAFRLGGSGTDRGLSLTTDPAGNAYLAGTFTSSADFDPGAGSANFTFPGVNGYMAKYSPAGSYLAGYGYDSPLYNVALDSRGNMYVSGHLQDSMDVDPGPGVVKLFSANLIDIFIERLDSTGKFVYATAFESNKVYSENGLAVDDQNSVYVYGFLNDTAYFNPKGGTGMLISQGKTDGYVAKLHPNGNFAYAFCLGSTSDDRVYSVVTDEQGDIWIAGYFTGTADFDPGTATVNQTSTAGLGAYFGRYTDHHSSGLRHTSLLQSSIKIYGTNHTIVVDFTGLQNVNANVKVLNIMGQTIAETNHTTSNLLKIDLPETSGQVCIVMVSNGTTTIAKKVWME